MTHRVTTLVLTVLMAMTALSMAPAAQAASRSVCLDPGHGGTDVGTANGGILEKDLNLQVALRLGPVLEASGYIVFYTRTDDSNPSRTERAQYCNSVGASILVSVHHNGSSNAATDYTTALYQKRIDKPLATVISQAVAPATSGSQPRIGQFASGVLVKSDMPATISESYFLTNNAELAKLNDATRDYRLEEAQALANGGVAYFQSH